MKFRYRSVVCFILPIFLVYMPLFSIDRIPLNQKRLSENIIVIQTKTGNSQVAVLRTDKGLVMIDTGFSPSFASHLKELAEKSFERADWAFLIQTNTEVLNDGGNQAFTEIPIIAHADAYRAFVEQQSGFREYLNSRATEFEERVRLSREYMKELDPKSERAVGLQAWIDLCRGIAQDFREGFEHNLPSMAFTDRMTLHLGNMDVILFYFGSSAEPGDVICWIPQEGFVWLGDVFHAAHILPYGSYDSRMADLPRWVWVFDQILNDVNPVKHVYRCNGNDLWTAETLKQRHDFIRDLYRKEAEADSNGTPLQDLLIRLSDVDVEFPYLRMWPDLVEDIVMPDIRRTVTAYWKIRHGSAAEKIGGMIDSEGLEPAVVFFDTIKNRPDRRFYFLESEFNSLGYRYLGQNRFEEAIGVFRMNAELYPESANVYDSLGEAYMKSGQRNLAVTNYEKSLELNPQNDNAIEMLNKLKDKKRDFK